MREVYSGQRVLIVAQRRHCHSYCHALLKSTPACPSAATNLFVAALAVSDLLVALNIPFYVSFYFDVSFKCDRSLCVARYAIAIFVTVLSVVLLLGVALDRYLGVIHPLKHHRIMRFKLAK